MIKRNLKRYEDKKIYELTADFSTTIKIKRQWSNDFKIFLG